MDPILFAAGLTIVVLATVDSLWTSLWVDGGAGPLSARVARWTWRGFLAVASGRSRTLSLGGPTILVLTLSMWIGLLWLGWTLLFASGEPALVHSNDGSPTDWIDRIYFTAYTIVTLGLGDVVPVDGPWQIATTFATANGILLVTLGVSYVLSVVEAVVDKRRLAGTVMELGRDPVTFVLTGWNGEDFSDLDPELQSLAHQLQRVSELHYAYPILHYYHSWNPIRSAPMSVAILDEAVTVLHHGVPDPYRPNPVLLRDLRGSTSAYVGSISGPFSEHADEPPPPDLDRLREAGVPTVDDDAFEASVEALDVHRRVLLSMVQADGWEWTNDGPGE